MNTRKIPYAELEKELEAAIGILKLKRGLVRPLGWAEKVKKTPFQIKVLQKLFKLTEFPSTATRRDLSLLLSIPQRSIQVWFQNTRQAKKKQRGTMMDQGIYSGDDAESDNEDVSLCQLIDIINSVKWNLSF